MIRAGGVSQGTVWCDVTPLCNILTLHASRYGDGSSEVEQARLLLAAGYDTAIERWLQKGRVALHNGDMSKALCDNVDSPQDLPFDDLMRATVCQNYCRDFLLELLLWPCIPKSLKFYSRISIRQTIGSKGLRKKLGLLNLPGPLFRYTDLQEL